MGCDDGRSRAHYPRDPCNRRLKINAVVAAMEGWDMKPPVVDLRRRDWRVQLKAALDRVLAEPIPENINQTLKGLK